MKSVGQVLRRLGIAAAVLMTVLGQANAGILYVSNFNNDTVTAYDISTGAFLGTPVTAGPEADGLNGIRIDPAGNFILTGQLSNTIVKYSASGTLVNVFDPVNSAGPSSPQDLAFGPDGNLYVVSSANDKILRYDAATGAFLGTFAELGGSGHLGPIGLAFGADGNLYVTSFDNDQIIRIDGQTGGVLGTTQGPPGIGFGPAVFGPDGNLYLTAFDLSTFAGSTFRYNIGNSTLDVFIPQGSGGLESAGGIAFGPDGNLLLANLVLDQNFNDAGSTVLEYNGLTGAPLGTLVAAGNGLDIPFFMAATTAVAAVPEPSSMVLFGMGVILLVCRNKTGHSANAATC